MEESFLTTYPISLYTGDNLSVNQNSEVRKNS